MWRRIRRLFGNIAEILRPLSILALFQSMAIRRLLFRYLQKQTKLAKIYEKWQKRLAT